MSNSMRLSLKSSTDVADARDMKRGHFLSWGESATNPPGAGCPILRAFCEGWDTTNLDTNRRLSHPLQRTQRMGHPPFRGASCRANTNRGLIEKSFLLRKPHTRSCLMLRNRKSRYVEANVGHPSVTQVSLSRGLAQARCDPSGRDWLLLHMRFAGSSATPHPARAPGADLRRGR